VKNNNSLTIKKILILSISIVFSSSLYSKDLKYCSCPTTVCPTADSKAVYSIHPLHKENQKIVKILTPQEVSVLEQRRDLEDQVANNPYSLILYKPSYILPFYYTGSPDTGIYTGNTPGNQQIMSSEFKGQLSIKVPIARRMFNDENSLDLAYTQVSYWQVYAASQYFRETNYEPEIFFAHLHNEHLGWQLGVEHQSNGRGGVYERSWNRAYGELILSNTRWMIHIKPWMPIFKSESMSIHNPDIIDYMGNGEVILTYKQNEQTLSLMFRNQPESNFQRGATELDWSFPLHGHFRGYLQLFSGYGQSLIEYNHYTNSAGIGIAFNDWA
jgi:phospholipase A1